MSTMATAGGGSVQSSREARRRRILERGSERLALVTGRIQSLPSDAAQSRPAASPTDQAPATSKIADSIQHGDIASDSALPEDEPRQGDVSDDTVKPSPHHHHGRGENIASRAAALLGVEKEYSQVSSRAVAMIGSERFSPVSSVVQGDIADHEREKLNHHHKSFTPSRISSAIAASENNRIRSSITAAILVILFHVGLPIPGWHILKGVILFKPFYLLFVANASIVVQHLILGKPDTGSKRGHTSTSPSLGGDGLAHLGKALELGLLLQRVLVALFMDFSIYAVVLICGLSVIKTFGG